ncbi:hypothetical protein K378_05115 [Streptomyces sp. Amel2xB2]|uniref:hypothetical protein n=1 Tax=Streptomyces sp. Amel2xB2 TaxID=1305829 RepID=UPI000DB9190D|nr:hypothetical protein [Streptomyces sp. Amel2xB2]RAJ58881.1 hypothetical protein K378_05115 [Streptomyces sp. Amel2xB2]
MSDEAGLWELRLGIHATPDQAEEIRERIAALLCPDPDHAPPCPVPWSLSLVALSGGDEDEDGDEGEAAGAYPELIEQARIERG